MAHEQVRGTLPPKKEISGARLPLWAAVLAPLAGAGATSLGAALFDRLKRVDAGRPSV